MAYEPPARMFHAALAMGHNMFIWGGTTSEDTSLDPSVVECFNVLSTSWEQPRRLSNVALPFGYANMAAASDGEKSYLFGGTNKSEELCNEIYEVHMPSLECKKLVPAADSVINTRGLSALVCVNGTLISYGGVTHEPHTMPTLSNKLFVFDHINKRWTPQETTGEKPPALGGHSFTMIDESRAILFGGCDGICYGSELRNDTYVLDVNTWHWDKIATSGKKPPARICHTTCVLTGRRTHIAVICGGTNDEIFSDMWLLDVSNESWSKVALPAKLAPRMAHSAAVFGSRGDFRVIGIFGGSKTPDQEPSDVISGTTLLLLSQRNESWVVDRVVAPTKLGPDHTLKEQMSRLKLRDTTTTGTAGSTSSKLDTATTGTAGSTSSKLAERPTLPQLLNLKSSRGNIFSAMSKDYQSIGPMLLNDDDGTIVDQISEECNYKGEKAITEILKRWLRGKGKEPVTWRTLIEVLYNLGLSELASQVEGSL